MQKIVFCQYYDRLHLPHTPCLFRSVFQGHRGLGPTVRNSFKRKGCTKISQNLLLGVSAGVFGACSVGSCPLCSACFGLCCFSASERISLGSVSIPCASTVLFGHPFPSGHLMPLSNPTLQPLCMLGGHQVKGRHLDFFQIIPNIPEDNSQMFSTCTEHSASYPRTCVSAPVPGKERR